MTLTRSFFSTVLMLASLAAAPATQPSGTGSLEVRATAAFSRGEYALALPMLRKLAEQATADPDKLGRLQEQIRVCEKELNGAAGASADVAAAQDPGALPPPPPTFPSDAERKKLTPPPAGQTAELTIKDLGNFAYDADKGGNIPADVKAMSGSKLRVKGYMIPMDQAESITQFALVPDLFACCFGQPPQVQHMVVANAPGGKAVSYYPDELVVEGTLQVREKKEDGFIVSIFEMDVASVKPAAK